MAASVFMLLPLPIWLPVRLSHLQKGQISEIKKNNYLLKSLAAAPTLYKYMASFMLWVEIILKGFLSSDILSYPGARITQQQVYKMLCPPLEGST